MNVKKILKQNNTDQKEFAAFLDLTTVGLCKKIQRNREEMNPSFLKLIKYFIAEKRGLKIDIDLNPQH